MSETIKVKFDTETSDLVYSWDEETVSITLDVTMEDYNRLLESAKSFKEMSEDENVKDIYKEVCDTIDEIHIDYYYEHQDILNNCNVSSSIIYGTETASEPVHYTRDEVARMVCDPHRKVYFCED